MLRRIKNGCGLAALLMLCAPLGAAQETDGAQPTAGKDEEPDVFVRFEGYVPGSIDRDLEGTFKVEFRIYRSPQGGEAIWRESQEVRVVKGRMDVELGRLNRIPMEIHEATFKFVGASVNGNREVYPRYPIVNVVFVTPKEALLARAEAEPEASYRPARHEVAARTEPPGTWRAALDAARKEKRDLPGYEDWYRSLLTAPSESVLERTGHYEWVLPWVYDTASHGRYNRYFRGRFEGCDYMDLSPEKSYVYRHAVPRAESQDKLPARDSEEGRR